MIQLQQISKSFGQIQVLRQASLEISPGERVCLLGPSGAGKTTTLRMIAGLDAPDAGQVVIEGEVASDPALRIPAERRQVGMVFQSLALWPHMTVRRNVEFVIQGVRSKERRARADELLRLVHLAERSDAYPDQLSGGQQQRLAIARALAPRPKILLLDEPLKSLQRPLQLEMAELIRGVVSRFELTVIWATQQPEVVAPFTGRVLSLTSGSFFEPQDWESVCPGDKSTSGFPA
jgi:iron(III) transport system ATP-binding protein